MEIKRLFDIPQYQLKNYPKDDALVGKVNGAWEKTSTQEYVDKANAFSRGLLELGIKPNDKIVLISNNRPEWNISDIGIMQIGAIDVPVYPTASADDYRFIFNDAEVKLCFVSDEELFEKVNSIKDDVPTLQGIYSYNKIDGVNHWSEVLELGKNISQEEVEKLKADVKEDDLATLIYTSGTTGTPKGVMLSHKNIASNSFASSKRLPVMDGAKAVSFLPVCHIYERMMMYLYSYTGTSIYFAESLETIGDNIREVKPDVFTAVPRLLEKVYDKIVAKGDELTGVKRALFFWAVSVGEKYEPYGKNGIFYEWQLGIARKLIFSKWQAALGGNVKAVASGSAALSPRLARVFCAAGIPIYEGYGLTETSPVVSVNEHANNGLRIGTVGRPIDGVTIKIADDGEILVKGPNVMMGYYKREDATSEVIDAEGWFHTGDIGTMIDGEFLKITDRKKEMFKTSGGKYVAPQIMENKFKESRFIEQIMVIGENEKHPAALIVPNFDFLKEYCKIKEIAYSTDAEMIKNEQIVNRIWQEIEERNASFGKWEQVKKVAVLAKLWTTVGGELTPKLSLRRKVILEMYKKEVETIYGR